MIPAQLDLFGGPPKPPKKIREEAAASAPGPTLPPAETEAPEQVPVPPPIAEDAPIDNSFMAAPYTHQPVEDDQQEWPDSETLPNVEDNHAAATTPPPQPVSEVIAWMAPQEIPAPPLEAALEAAAADDITAGYPTRLELSPIIDETILIASPAEDAHATTPNDGWNEADKWTPDAMNVPPDEMLFKRQYYSMRETAAMFGISHSMLRYWENEFDILQPRKNKKGDRFFRPPDIKNLQLIYHLLKVRRFTIEGAREYLRSHHKALDGFELIKKLEKIKLFLHELKAHL